MPQYLIVDLRARSEEGDHPGPARLHFWRQPNRPPQLVGLERPEGEGAPR